MQFSARLTCAAIFFVLISLFIAKPAYAEWNADLIRPSCNISFTPQSPQKSGTIINITASATDADSGIVSITLKNLSSLSDTTGVELRTSAASFNYSWNTLSLQPKDYYFTVIAKDKAGNVCVNPVAAFTLTPPSPPLAVNCTASKTKMASGDTVTWTASVSGGEGVYSYQFSGAISKGFAGSTSTIQRVSAPFITTYGDIKYETVTVTSAGVSRSADCPVLTVYPPPTVRCAASPPSAPTNYPITWTAYASGGLEPYTFEWSGATVGSGQTFTTSYISPGTKYTTLRVSDGFNIRYANCSTQIYSPLQVSCSSSPNPAYTSENITWTASASGGDGRNYSYYFRGNVYKNDPFNNTYSSSAQATYTDPNTYTANVYVNSGLNYANTSCSVNVVRPSVPPGPFNVNRPSPNCDTTSGTASINLSWSNSSNASYYRVWRLHWEGYWAAQGFVSDNLTDTNFADTSFEPQNYYSYYVQAYNNDGIKWSNWSDWVLSSASCGVVPGNFNYKPNPPVMACNGPQRPYAQVGWTAALGAKNYVVWRFSNRWEYLTTIAAGSAGGDTAVKTSNTSPLGGPIAPRSGPTPRPGLGDLGFSSYVYTDYGPNPDTWYKYYVYAQNDFGTSFAPNLFTSWVYTPNCNLTLTCSSSPQNGTSTGFPVTWTMTPSGGTPPASYFGWQGGSLDGTTGNQVTQVYNDPGIKTENAIVQDKYQTAFASCSTNIYSRIQAYCYQTVGYRIGINEPIPMGISASGGTNGPYNYTWYNQNSQVVSRDQYYTNLNGSPITGNYRQFFAVTDNAAGNIGSSCLIPIYSPFQSRVLCEYSGTPSRVTKVIFFGDSFGLRREDAVKSNNNRVMGINSVTIGSDSCSGWEQHNCVSGQFNPPLPPGTQNITFTDRYNQSVSGSCTNNTPPPDLTSQLSTPTTTVILGQRLTFSGFISNIGAYPTGNNFNARFCLDSRDQNDCLVNGTGKIGNDQQVNTLEATGSPAANSPQLSVSWDAAGEGTHYLYLCADPGRSVNSEVNRDNNCDGPKTFQVIRSNQPFIQTEQGDVHSNEGVVGPNR